MFLKAAESSQYTRALPTQPDHFGTLLKVMSGQMANKLALCAQLLHGFAK